MLVNNILMLRSFSHIGILKGNDLNLNPNNNGRKEKRTETHGKQAVIAVDGKVERNLSKLTSSAERPI